MYTVVLSTRARKALQKYGRSGAFPQQKLKQGIHCLKEGRLLPISYKDHQLKGELSIYREFHIGYDLLVQYKRNDEKKIITIAKIGTHVELFGN